MVSCPWGENCEKSKGQIPPFKTDSYLGNIAWVVHTFVSPPYLGLSSKDDYFCNFN